MKDNIGGFKVGDRVKVLKNGGRLTGRTGEVVTLDHDHGQRLWVIISDWELVLNDPEGVSLYMDPDDLEPAFVNNLIPLSELKRLVDGAWECGDGTVNLQRLTDRLEFLVYRPGPHEPYSSVDYREDFPS